MIRTASFRIVAVVVAAISLSSCRVDSSISMKVNPNGSGAITVVVTADKDIVDKAPGLEADLRTDDLVAAGWSVDKPVTTKDGGLSVTLRHSFANPAQATAILAQVNGARGPLHEVSLTRSGRDTDSTWTLKGRLEVNGGLEAFADDAALQLLDGAPYSAEVSEAGMDLGDAVGVDFAVTLPGKVDATTGLVSDGRITWRVPMDGTPTDIATTTTNVDIASSISRVGRVLLLALLALWVVGTLILLMLVLNARNRRQPLRRTPRL